MEGLTGAEIVDLAILQVYLDLLAIAAREYFSVVVQQKDLVYVVWLVLLDKARQRGR